MHVIGAVLGIMQLVWTIFFSLTIGNIIMIPLIVFGFGLIGHLYLKSIVCVYSSRAVDRSVADVNPCKGARNRWVR